MSPITSILFYVEDEPETDALDGATQIAKAMGAKLTLCAVVAPARSQVLLARGSLDIGELERLLIEDRQRQLDDVAGRVAAEGVDVVPRVFVGDPTDAVVDAVQNEGFDLLIKSPSPAHGRRQRLFGSIDMRLLRACPCPVRISIGRLKSLGHSNHAVAAVAYDEGNETHERLNQAILDFAARVFAHHDAPVGQVHVVHAWSLYGESILSSGRAALPPEKFEVTRQQEEQSRHRWLVELVDRYRSTLDQAGGARFDPKLSLLHGDAKVVIPRFVEEVDAAVLTMGTTSRRGVAGLLFGNTAEEILSRVNCSVLTLKPQGFKAPA